MNWWQRDPNEPAAGADDKKSVPSGVFTQCDGCGEALVDGELQQQHGVCPACGHHHYLAARRRVELLLDPGSFVELGGAIEPLDPLAFEDTKRYQDRLRAARQGSGYSEAVLVGLGRLEGRAVALGVLVFEFIGGSMGSVMGERLARLFEAAAAQGCPAIVCSASGGARMQEGILSLMQMAKTTAVLARMKRRGLPFVSVLCHPTTGGVAASFAMLGDLHLAEPGALIGFAGPRVIEQTIRQTLPEGFQRAEFLLEHGMIDAIVPRRELRATLARLLGLLLDPPVEPAA
ncbi:MAG: acetyl-CoA carboxylase carboxyltransferase subunit beta [Proteobacteria bacterium]|nr:acetyl-CoA carboxylase carboxyltransferase subunit beta [Pseudomonadota bacterium]